VDRHDSLNERARAEGHTSRRWWLVVIGAAGVILLAALLWPSSRKAPELTRKAPPTVTAARPAEPEPPSAKPSAPKQLVAVHQEQAPEASAEAEDEEPHADDPPFNENATPEGHPHYTTPQHERIFRENNLLGQLNGAMQVGDFIAMRRFNAEYRKDYPEDDHRVQEGYEIIADCLDDPTDARKARAERFWKTQRASMVRRYVRRYCLSEP